MRTSTGRLLSSMYGNMAASTAKSSGRMAKAATAAARTGESHPFLMTGMVAGFGYNLFRGQGSHNNARLSRRNQNDMVLRQARRNQMNIGDRVVGNSIGGMTGMY